MRHTARQVKHATPIRSRVHQRVHKRVSHAAKNSHHFIDNLANRSEAMLNEAEAQMNAVKEKGHDYVMSVEHYIEKNPLKAVGLAAAAGIIFALSWRR